jgi:hypothetical protein
MIAGAAARRDGVDLPGDQTGSPLPGTAGLGVGSCHLAFLVGSGGERDAELGPEHGSPEEAHCDVFVLRLASSACSVPVIAHATYEAHDAIRVFTWRRGGMPRTRRERCPSRSSEPLLISVRRRPRGA